VWLLALSLQLLSGCGGPANVAPVQGTVTLGGKPLPQALVTFVSQSTGSLSRGRTDDNGQYRLLYSADVEGAEIGPHRVTISTFQSGDADGDPPTPRVPEQVPARYNRASELVAEVAQGSNQVNFELETGGPIDQPDRQQDPNDG